MPNNGWYQLEQSKLKKPSPFAAERQRGMMARTPYVPAQPPAPAPPEPTTAAEPAPPPEPVAETALKLEPAPEPEFTPVQPPLPRGPHSQTVGPNGPVLLQDNVLHETLNDFVTDTVPERAVHGKGWGAFGRFTCEHSMGEYTMLPFLQREGQSVDTVSRFSLAISNRGTPDTARNVRGFSTKFYTSDGVFDLLCNHLPVFAVRDAIRFPEVIRALSPSPMSGLIEPGRFWDFVAQAPESLHFVTWLYSDVGTLKSLRHLRAYGVNTYVWKNTEGERRYVKYHWVPGAGTEFITAQAAERLAGEDPDIAGRDLWEAVAGGAGPEYELRVQLMDPADARDLPYDPLDCTKVWDETRYPLLPVGRLKLLRNPENYREQVEKLAFSPANLLPGAELSDDKMLQGRANVYWSAQRHRLGHDFRTIPVNRQADWRPDRLVTSGLGVEVSGTQTRSALQKQDDFTQAGERFRAFSTEEQDHLAANLAQGLRAAPDSVRGAVLSGLFQADEAYGSAVAQKLAD